MSRELSPLPGNGARGLAAPQPRIPVVNATAEGAATADVFLTFGEVFGALWAAKGRVMVLAAAERPWPSRWRSPSRRCSRPKP